ncbi:apolipoprotein L6-like [Carassius auratus]|uniref:Apolipoprotein L6-like n=1 Tax=Carassius auratus TaxID=7957 RepID=A0A6P6N6D3_CARAU|nr:apolipoprotein L6-like [Carassius auratus]XP_026104570.1 apolipoprotein L6-like [Carassius auratus]XP_026104571.1 apolipoprotein L6-like [Carassius auratus]XP_026104572.1 apolipoprotein L6-like [Carassius auratus]
MQKLYPFKSSSQSSAVTKASVNNDGKQDTPVCSSSSWTGEAAESRETQHKQDPGIIMGMIQKLNPFRFSSQNKISEALTVSAADEQTQDHGGMRDHLKSTAQVSDEAEGQNASSAIDDTCLTAQIDQAAETDVPVSSEGNPLDNEDDEDGLLAWWRTVEGWSEWNESKQFNEKDGEQAIESAANRVFMSAKLFVHLLSQREPSLQRRIHELLTLADAADSFHWKTVTASVGGGVASVAGSITTITGLVLAPFTFGTSLIVTAVGIGVATAGGVTSASANITDTVHSNTDRKKVEKMIQDYQQEVKDIKECLDFLQAGMETLQEWHFEQYVDSITRRALNQNVKHVLKEGGRAGKALLVNTDSLINTVQVLSVAGGAAKAAQVISITTGVMSGLFLALDVFFLAKGSLELRKGAKTEFAAKIREVCKELQNGLQELKRIQLQLQKTMDGVEMMEEEEEEDEEEEEEEEEEEAENHSEPKK